MAKYFAGGHLRFVNGEWLDDNGDAIEIYRVRHGRWEWFEEWNPSTPDNPTECEACGWRCGECKTALEDMVYGIFDDPDDEPKLKLLPKLWRKDGRRRRQ